MDIAEILSYAVTAIGAGGVTQVVNWRLNKRKASAEVKSDEIDNMRKAMQDFYEPLVERQNTRIGELEKEVATLRSERVKMQEDYQRQISTLQEDYRKQLAAMQKQIGELYKVMGVRTAQTARGRKKKEEA